MSSILPHRVMCERVCSCFFCAIQLFSHAYFCCNITEFAVETFICWSVLTVQLETLPATASLPNNMPMPCIRFGEWELIIIIWMRIDANIRERRRAHFVKRMAIGIFSLSLCTYAIFSILCETKQNLIQCRLTVVIHLHRYSIDSMCRYRVATSNVRGCRKYSHGKKSN